MASNTPTPQDIWSALRNAGFSSIQAAGVMGNMLAESSFDVESNVSDPAQGCPKARAYGLINWNDCTYHDASTLVTGNPQNDLKAQVSYLIKTGGMAAAQGATASEVGSRFAHSYERCAACGYQGGTGELTIRARNADAVYQAAASGDWSGFSAEAAVNQAADSQAPGSGQGPGCSGCAIHLKLLGCALSNCQVKALKGGLLVVAGGALFTVGGLILVAYGFQRTGLGSAAQSAYKATPAGRLVSRAPGASGAPASRTAGSGATRRQAASQRARLRRDIASGKVTYPDEADEPRVQRAARQSSQRNQEIARRRRSEADRRIARRTTTAA